VDNKNEIGLDPENWEDIRTLGHQMVDDMINYLKNVEERPAWKEIPETAIESYKTSIPQKPENIFTIYKEFKENIFPYSTGNIHPKFFAWVQGTGTPLGALADFMASTMNSNVAIGNQSALYIENQVIDWCKEMFNYPASASGILVSGASIANITALLVARSTISDNAKKEGVYAINKKLTAYCSVETHNCVSKAIEVIGIGSNQLRKIPVNNAFEIDIEALKNQIKKDRAEGFFPFCIVGNVGTVNTGAIDPVDELVEIAQSEKLWLHIDGAFGGLAKLVPEYSKRLEAIEQADSLAFDLHKWMYMPYEVGCVLIKNSDLHRSTFAAPANYLLAHERGLSAGPEPFANFGMELSRGFKALKVWMSFKEHGLEKYSKMIAQNIAQAKYLGELVEENSQLELLAAVSLNIVCFRYRAEGMDTTQLNAFNKELLMQIQEKGIAAPSYTLLNGSYAIRVAITNHRTRKQHLEEMISQIVTVGNEILSEPILNS
jgi:aromatic-L-amino-acid/L-tryptophan decarboxylase